MNGNNEFTQENYNAIRRCNKKMITSRLLMILSIMLILQGCNTNQNNIDIAITKVANLFEVEDEEQVKEGKSGKIKDSTDQSKIDEALKAIDNIDTSDGEHSESYAIAFGLQSAVLVAQVQLDEREGKEVPYENNSEEEEPQTEQFQPNDDDIIWQDNELKNKDMLENFMNNAGENGKNHGSEISVVKDEGEKGVIIYDLKSRYDENADQAWIDVTPNLSHYIEADNDVQNVFNMNQQCGYISKDREAGYYKLNECFTHWEYSLLPITNNNQE